MLIVILFLFFSLSFLELLFLLLFTLIIGIFAHIAFLTPTSCSSLLLNALAFVVPHFHSWCSSLSLLLLVFFTVVLVPNPPSCHSLLLAIGFRSWCSWFYHDPPFSLFYHYHRSLLVLLPSPPSFLVLPLWPFSSSFVAITPFYPCLPLPHLLLVLLAFPSLSWCCHHIINSASRFPSLVPITFFFFWCCHHLKP